MHYFLLRFRLLLHNEIIPQFIAHILLIKSGPLQYIMLNDHIIFNIESLTMLRVVDSIVNVIIEKTNTPPGILKHSTLEWMLFNICFHIINWIYQTDSLSFKRPVWFDYIVKMKNELYSKSDWHKSMAFNNRVNKCNFYLLAIVTLNSK